MKNYIKRMENEYEWMPEDAYKVYANSSFCLYSNDDENIYMHESGNSESMPVANLIEMGSKEDVIDFIRSFEEEE